VEEGEKCWKRRNKMGRGKLKVRGAEGESERSRIGEGERREGKLVRRRENT
jgi:hypothetical protein